MLELPPQGSTSAHPTEAVIILRAAMSDLRPIAWRRSHRVARAGSSARSAAVTIWPSVRLCLGRAHVLAHDRIRARALQGARRGWRGPWGVRHLDGGGEGGGWSDVRGHQAVREFESSFKAWMKGRKNRNLVCRPALTARRDGSFTPDHEARDEIHVTVSVLEGAFRWVDGSSDASRSNFLCVADS